MTEHPPGPLPGRGPGESVPEGRRELAADDATALAACPCCGLVQRVPELAPRKRAVCPRCAGEVRRPGSSRGTKATLAAALAGLVLYPLAISLPVMELERFGHVNRASVWSGSVGLLREGELVVGLVVLFASIVLPLGKLLALVGITGSRSWLARRHRAVTWRFVEWTGRWGMLDVLLLAVVVAWLKFRSLVEVTPGPGAVAFTACVFLSLLASAWFDPQALWSEGGDALGDRG